MKFDVQTDRLTDNRETIPVCELMHVRQMLNVLFLSGAKDLIEHLLVVDKKRRFTAIDVLCHPWILCGGDVSGMNSSQIEELRKATRKELETQAALNRESYQKMKEKRALNG